VKVNPSNHRRWAKTWSKPFVIDLAANYYVTVVAIARQL